MALVLTLLIMVILAMVIAGLSGDIRLDLDITRNISQKDEALNWTESGLVLSEETIASQIIARDGNSSNNDMNVSMDYGTSSFVVSSISKSEQSWGNRTLILQESGTVLAETDVVYLGSSISPGGSLIVASGYAGVGKGAGSSGSVVLSYVINANGSVRNGNGKQKISEVYHYAGR